MGVHGWTVLMCEARSLDRVSQELVQELEFLAEEESLQVTIRHLRLGPDGRSLVDELTLLPLPSVCVVQAGASNLSSAIGFVEASRGRLVSGPTIALVTDEEGARAVAVNAPNIWSWVGSRMWHDVKGITAADIDARLKSLREATGRTDQEIVGLAEAGQLSPDPIYAEWLALLGRGDLLGD